MLFLYSIFLSSLFGKHAVLASASTKNNDDAVMSMVNDLNEQYANGKPSDDYGEIGIVLRIIDGLCQTNDPLNTESINRTCDHDMANAPPSRFFEGTVDRPDNLPSTSLNEMISSPKESKFGDKIELFEGWPVDLGPAAGIVWYPCAVEKNTRCMWPMDGDSDRRPLTCGRLVVQENMDLSVPGCTACLSENNTLSAEENTVDGRTIQRLDDVFTEANTSSYEIELLFNRAKGKTVDTTFEASGDITRFKTISPTCEQCKSNLPESAKEQFSAQQINVTEQEIEQLVKIGFYGSLVQFEYGWFEGPGYYGQFDDDSVTPPRNELKQMMEANLKYFGANRDYSEMLLEYQITYSYNEWAIDAEGMKRLEEDRTLFSTESSSQDSLNFEGYDSEGTCGAAIKALVLICGDQDDPFYYGKPGQCLDFAEVYKKNYGSADTPPVVYMNRKNLTHPFSSTCDIEISCGVEKIGNESKTDAADVQVNEEEDASTNDTLSAASTNLVLLSGCGYLVSSLLALFYM